MGRTNILPSELKVGQRVAIAESYNPQMGYIVAKVDKLKVILRRESDGYERKWSVKRNEEQPHAGRKYVSSRYSYIISEAEAQRQVAVKQQGNNFSNACRALEAACSTKNLTEIRRCMAELEGVDAIGKALLEQINNERNTETV